MGRRVERPVVKNRTRKRREQTTPRERAEELHAKGIPFQLAMAVAHGRLDLSTALERLATREKVDRLMEQHDLSRALATQIAIGHASLDQVMARRRMEDHRRLHRNRSILLGSVETGEPVVVALHGGQRAPGVVQSVRRYDFDFLPQGFDEPIEIRKLQVKFAYRPADWKALDRALGNDRAREKRPLSPAERPQDRFSLADKRLFQCMDKGQTVAVTLLEGEVIRGKVAWFGRWEFGLRLRGDAEVVIFRHAIAGFSSPDSQSG